MGLQSSQQGLFLSVQVFVLEYLIVDTLRNLVSCDSWYTGAAISEWFWCPEIILSLSLVLFTRYVPFISKYSWTMIEVFIWEGSKHCQWIPKIQHLWFIVRKWCIFRFQNIFEIYRIVLDHEYLNSRTKHFISTRQISVLLCVSSTVLIRPIKDVLGWSFPITTVRLLIYDHPVQYLIYIAGHMPAYERLTRSLCHFRLKHRCRE